ncbi:ATP-binding protein [Rufibacter sp. LB8]|uniref:sensor histidine kinase n=1 Tax=Rufibacter sp. LB8 TaxID=2777781 RepID=UPI00178C7686|nr:HAMP domain-containing sensor histidine kinase [Rufibacter sp. LB8]
MNQSELAACQEQLRLLRNEYEEFAYIVSHDLKAPLRAISNLSSWIKEDLGTNLDPDISHNINLLQNRSERLEGMINAILMFSRINRQDLEIVEVDATTLVHQMAKPLEEAGSATVQVSGLPTFTTYAKKLETVLRHLIQNGVQFNEQKPALIEVSASDQGAFYTFTVKDQGLGIPADAHEKIFKMFYTVQPKEKVETLGAGLTIVKKIVTFVGGQVTIFSAPGQGTQISFTWPKEVSTFKG